MATRLGVDVGGTFTDLIFYDDATGEVRLAKEPTTPEFPEQGVLAAVAAGVPSDRLSAAQYFLHGTTVGLNALLERRGAVVGLLATEGFRDALEIRRGDRSDPYDLFWKAPAPLVPRRLRLPVGERVLASGAVRTPLVEEDVRRSLEVFREEGVTAVAIAFLHAYANPEHELAAERILRAEGFDGEISLSHQVSGEYREYERTCTTVIDAFVRARMSNYLRRLEQRLGEAGFSGSPLITRSGGGALSFGEAEGRPFETIMSGPVAGAEGAAELARDLQLDSVITADVGGTSFDTCLITDGRPRVLYEGEIVGLPLQTSWVDVRSIGAGGGSIAYVDEGGLLRVGPRSAGAVPGPACYGRGGTEPTVTDAAFLLGMLGPGQLASGLQLDRAEAAAAVAPLAEALGLSEEHVARGILTIATANMANAIREITVEQGTDPREGTLLPFGGAGPLFGTLLAQELQVSRVVVPPFAGNFSAWGLLGADITQTAARTRIMRLGDEALASANTVLAELFAGLSERAAAADGDGKGVRPKAEVALDMRYVGQEHTITILVAEDGGRIDIDAAELGSRFGEEYERTFGHTMEEVTEIVAVRATLRTPLPRRGREQAGAAASSNGAGPRSISAYSFSADGWLDFDVVDRADIDETDGLHGPAIILEETATTYVDAGFEVTVHPSGSLFMTDRSAA
jgi:N-methylhydantoinase A